MDFIVELPKINGFDAVLVIVDRLTKMAHFLPCSTTIDAPKTADLFVKEIVRLHGLPDDIVSDRGPVFVSKFWNGVLSLLGIKRNLSSGYHPESDGQTERVNQVLEQYLRCFANYRQDNWLRLLSSAEFTYNNTLHESIQTTPFFANYGYHPRFSTETLPSPVNPASEQRIQELHDVHEDLKMELRESLERYKETADRHRLETPEFQPGDKVWLLRRNIKTTRPCAKLDYKKLGPFEIEQQINPVAYKLILPEHYRIHPVFHVSLLEEYNPSDIPGRLPEPPAPVEIEGEEYWEVEKIIDSFVRRRKLYYVVKWHGYPESEATPEPLENMTECIDLVQEFHRQYPDKPGPTSRTPSGRRR